jgi:EmrB/QacA subfamily drug resistance transporter
MDRKWWTLLAVCAGVFMLVVDITIVNVALPDIQRRFDASLAQLQWVIDAYTLTLAALLLTAGSIADLVGRRRVFAFGLVVFTVGSALCGAAPDATALVLARVVQGVGGAVIFATSLALLAEAFTPPERGAAFAVWGAVLGVAAAMGPVLGGVITSGLSWRWVFFVSVPVGVLALAATLTRVRESRSPVAARPDWPGFLTFSTGLAGLILGLIRSHADGWDSATVVVSLAAAAVLLAAFVLVESRARAPMLDLRLLRVPTFGGGLIAAWSLNASIYSLFTFLVLYLQNVLGATPVQTGLRLFAMTGAMFVTSAVAGRLTNRVATRWLISSGFALVGAGLLLMRGLTADGPWTHLLPGLIAAGLGVGLVTVPLASTAVGVVEPARAGMASGINSTLRMVGLATGVAAMGSILAGHASFVDGLNAILAIGTIVAFAAAILTAVLIRQRDFAGVPSPATAAS